MEVFQLEYANLLAIYLKRYFDDKIEPIHITLYNRKTGSIAINNETEVAITSTFKRDNWNEAIYKLKMRSPTHYSDKALLLPQDINIIYKSSLTFYARGVLNSTEINCIPKLYHFLHSFMQTMLESPPVVDASYFSNFGYQDRLQFVRSVMRITLHKIFTNSQKMQGGLMANGDTKATPAVQVFSSPLKKKTVLSAHHRHHGFSRSIGPEDSISVAPYSRLQPKLEKLPTMRDSSLKGKASHHPNKSHKINKHISYTSHKTMNRKTNNISPPKSKNVNISSIEDETEKDIHSSGVKEKTEVINTAGKYDDGNINLDVSIQQEKDDIKIISLDHNRTV